MRSKSQSFSNNDDSFSEQSSVTSNYAVSQSTNKEKILSFLKYSQQADPDFKKEAKDIVERSNLKRFFVLIRDSSAKGIYVYIDPEYSKIYGKGPKKVTDLDRTKIR